MTPHLKSPTTILSGQKISLDHYMHRLDFIYRVECSKTDFVPSQTDLRTPTNINRPAWCPNLDVYVSFDTARPGLSSLLRAHDATIALLLM